MIATTLLLAASLLVADATAHPWLDKQEAKQRYPLKPDPKLPIRGPADAKVTINEFTDFDCPYCAQEEPIIQQVLAAYPTQVKLVFKNLPLAIHPGARHKAIVAECIGLQGRFWQAHDRMLKGAPAKEWSEGCDEAQLKACVEKGGEGQVDRDLALAKSVGMATTPGFVIDGIRQGGMIGLAQLKLLIDAELARKAKAASE